MFGVILGLISASAFGVNSIITRRGMLRVSSNYVATVTIFTGPIFFLIIAGFTGDLLKLKQFQWQAYVFLALSGIIHFALGRTWAYRSIQLIGSTRSNIVTNMYPIVTIVLAMIILKESVTLIMVIGILFTLTGPLLIFLKEQVVPGNTQLKTYLQGRDLDRPTLHKGILYGLGAAFFWGSSTIFIKLGLEHGGSPIAGSLIAYLSASVAVIPSTLFDKEHRDEILNGDKQSLKMALWSGLTSNIAQLMRYLALEFGSAIIISLMLRTIPLWVLFFAFIFNREYESFSRFVLLGNAFIVVGTVLILMS